MMNILSRYRPRYVRSLVYMLQASEYNVRDYLAWVHRTNDFAHVEKRKQLEKTPKALTLLTLTWLMFVAWVVGVMSFVGSTGSGLSLVVGALVVLVSPLLLPYAILIPLFAVHLAQRPVETYVVARARSRLRRHKGLKIAIAGSYGKTSMREILKTILSESKKVAAPGGSYNTPLGIAKFVSTLKGDEEVLIFELGEYYPGDVRTLCELVRPDIGIITGVNEAHLEKFETLEKTAATIFELSDWLGDKPLYVNAENVAARAKARTRGISYSREGVGEWRVESPLTNLTGTSFILRKGSDIVHASSKLLGLHMVGPLAVAADIAVCAGLTPAHIERGIARTKPFAHRLEPHMDAAGVVTIDDSYNGNPDGVTAIIEFLAGLTGRRRWYVTPGLVEMGARTEAVHRDIGKQLAAAHIEKVVLIRDSVTPYIEQGLKDAGYAGDVIRYDDMPACLEAISRSTVSGDVVLIQNDWPDQYA